MLWRVHGQLLGLSGIQVAFGTCNAVIEWDYKRWVGLAVCCCNSREQVHPSPTRAAQAGGEESEATRTAMQIDLHVNAVELWPFLFL